MKILVATNNLGKVDRYRRLLRNTDIELCTPSELGIDVQEVVEDGKTLQENAERKARAYLGKTDLPILANDTGFYVEGEGFVDAPKRIALTKRGEKELTQREVAEAMRDFWKSIATKYGGRVDAAWIEEFVLLLPDGTLHTTPCRREVVLTNTVHGKTHLQLPIRALYISKTTGKPSVLHTPEEEDEELLPVRDALLALLVP